MVCFLSLLVHPGGVSDEKIFKEVYGPSVDFAGIPCIRQKQTNKKPHDTALSETILSVPWPLVEITEEQCP